MPLSHLPSDGSPKLAVELIAVVVAATAGEPRVLTLADGALLPSGPFETAHGSLQSGVRSWAERQMQHPLGFVEQLYTFADRDRGAMQRGPRTISISYVGLTREEPHGAGEQTGWRDWYRYFPWEDRRPGASNACMPQILTRLSTWAATATDPAERRHRRQRIAITFGTSGHPWNEELALQRYELLYEAGVVPEASDRARRRRVRSLDDQVPEANYGQPMKLDHRRILATAIARLRAKIKYRPVVFELMPPRFTLLQLQRTVEGLAGRALHKQNFRRLIEQQQLVEPTGRFDTAVRGRPAQLFRFRRAVLAERSVIGTKLPLVHAAGPASE